MPPVPDRLDLDHRDAVARAHIRIDDPAVMRENIADLLRVRTADRDHDQDLDPTQEVAVAVGRVIEVTIVRDNSGRTIIAAHTTNHASKALTIQIIVAAVTISRIETAFITTSTIIVLAIAAVLTIVEAVVAVVIVAVDSFMANKVSVISATGETSETAVPRVIDTVIAVTRPTR